MSLVCKFAGHKRNKSRSRVDRSGHFTSECARCGLPLQKSDGGTWRVDEMRLLQHEAAGV